MGPRSTFKSLFRILYHKRDSTTESGDASQGTSFFTCANLCVFLNLIAAFRGLRFCSLDY